SSFHNRPSKLKAQSLKSKVLKPFAFFLSPFTSFKAATLHDYLYLLRTYHLPRHGSDFILSRHNNGQLSFFYIANRSRY
ncbi:MAG TPA: hypothetical protein VIM16_04620, partial [Mucilaginibacter sp.]